MKKPITNYGKSVKTRLLNLMNEKGYKYMYLLSRYFNERLLYRVSVSQYKDNFLLKGGSLLYAVDGLETRPTIDIDFMASRIVWTGSISKPSSVRYWTYSAMLTVLRSTSARYVQNLSPWRRNILAHDSL